MGQKSSLSKTNPELGFRFSTFREKIITSIQLGHGLICASQQNKQNTSHYHSYYVSKFSNVLDPPYFSIISKSLDPSPLSCWCNTWIEGELLGYFIRYVFKDKNMPFYHRKKNKLGLRAELCQAQGKLKLVWLWLAPYLLWLTSIFWICQFGLWIEFWGLAFVTLDGLVWYFLVSLVFMVL